MREKLGGKFETAEWNYALSSKKGVNEIIPGKPHLIEVLPGLQSLLASDRLTVTSSRRIRRNPCGASPPEA
jgi:hypothetical protein